MIKSFIVLISLLLLLSLAMVLHSVSFDYESSSENIRNISELSHVSRLSLSAAYDESVYNQTYPQMPTLERRHFVYEK